MCVGIRYTRLLFVSVYDCFCVSGCDTDPCGVAGLTALMSKTPSRARERNGTTKLTKK